LIQRSAQLRELASELALPAPQFESLIHPVSSAAFAAPNNRLPESSII
jgi:hypothetical protein